MDKESIYDLQKIDCNCNNCVFMYRDINTWQKWHDWHKELALKEFERLKEKAIADALLVTDEANRAGMLRVANKMQFQFDKTKLLNYGMCSKLSKPVSFIPNICQIDTQNCFTDRKNVS